MLLALERTPHLKMLLYILIALVCSNFLPARQLQASVIAIETSGPPVERVDDVWEADALQVNAPLRQRITGDDVDSTYVPEFGNFDRGILGRQEATSNELKDNDMKEMDISPGSTTHFVLRRGRSRTRRVRETTPNALETQDIDNASEDALAQDDAVAEEVERGDLATRQQGNRVFISASTCKQPSAAGNNTRSAARKNPQLVMYVSLQNQKPSPTSPQNLVTDPTGVLFDGGFANFSIQTDSDIYIGISAPNLDADWFGSWRFQVAASTLAPYHSYDDSDTFLFMVDTDSESALFITYPLSESNASDNTEEWKNNNPFRMYAFPAGAGSPISGVERSYCALRELFNSTNNLTVAADITTKFGSGNPRDTYPKSQFHMQGLENGKTYNGFLVVEGNQSKALQLPAVGRVGSGGKVFQQFNWTTKAEDSCQVLFDLEFCDSVAYAVPSSPEFKFDNDGLKKLYDDQARSYYTNFSRSLAQIACDTVSEAQYSLARTCKDCAEDYKTWLCSVLIPRCEDWSAPDEWLQERNVAAPFGNGSFLDLNQTRRDRFGFNQSRNPMIDDRIKPGPYKEMLPCQDLCFDIVRSCPAKLGFSCPNSPARELSYGQRDVNELKCSFPGAVIKLNVQGAASTFATGMKYAVPVAVATMASLWL